MLLALNVLHPFVQALIFGGGSGNGASGQEFAECWVFDFTSKSWWRVPTLAPTWRGSHFAVVVGHVMYVLLGFDEFTSSAPPWTLDLQTWQWSVLAQPPSIPPQYQACAYAQVGQLVYINGGNDFYGDIFPTSWCYDTSRNLWFEITDIDASSGEAIKQSYHAGIANNGMVSAR